MHVRKEMHTSEPNSQTHRVLQHTETYTDTNRVLLTTIMLPAVCVAWQPPLPAHGSWRHHQRDTTHEKFSVLHCTALGSWSQKAGQRINDVFIKITYDA